MTATSSLSLAVNDNFISKPQSETRRFLIRNLMQTVHELAPTSGVYGSSEAGVRLHRSDTASSCERAICEPSLCFILHGSCSLRFGDREIIYEPLTYLVSNIPLPVIWQALDTTPEQPFLAAKITLDAKEVADLLLESGQQVHASQHEEQDCPDTFCCLSMEQKMDNNMLLAVTRLLSLLKTPEDIPALAPLARREILYRALRGEVGPSIRKFATVDSQAHRISRVVASLRERYNQPLRISELADEANMSESTLFHAFKKVTRMSPLQYQKQLRLQEARRLMLTDGLEAAVASYRVGYESPSQFSREYSRMFGASPRADVTRLRGQPEQASLI